MAKQPGFYWYPNDWFGDVELQLTSTTTKGVWIQMLGRMDRAINRGVLEGNVEQLAGLLNVTQTELKTALDEFQLRNVCEVAWDKSGTKGGHVRIVSRRMTDEAKSKEKERLRKQRYRTSGSCPGNVPDTSLREEEKEREREEERS